MGFLRALAFLTRIPVFIKVNIDEHTLARSVVFFPAVGLIIGLALGFSDVLLSYLFPPALQGAFLLIASIIITGGLHLEGLADTADGILSGRPKEKALDIMKDSRIGAFGAITLIMTLILKYSFFISLPGHIRFQALVFSPMLSRWIMVAAIVFFPYARKERGMGTAFVEHTGKTDFILGGLLHLPAAYILLGSKGIYVTAAAFLLIMPVMFYIYRKIEGMTGDTYGALNEIAEAVSLTLFILGDRLHG
jgi:adenosylcobinamide-GDP ribazoletransferase